MTNHPIHMHGPHFAVTGTDGGWVPKSARWPEVTTDIAVGQMRAIEFDALAGDWAIHCHKSHHTMNAMGHGVPTMIGVDQSDVAKKITSLVPDYMVMGDKGMHDMAEMEMPIPDNTLPMMTGTGPFGPIGMGGMFSVVKVRDDIRPGDYTDPGPYKHPAGALASEYRAETPEAVRAPGPKADSNTLQVRKPRGHEGH
jgi:manganese oxidase